MVEIDDDETPAGVRLSYVDAYVHHRSRLQDAEAVFLERISDLKNRMKRINQQLYALNRRRPDQQLTDDMPLISGLAIEAPAGTATVEINLDSGRESALVCLDVARERLTEEEYCRFVAEFAQAVGFYD